MLSIDMTDMNAREIIGVLRNYPRGKLEIKYERVFWVSDINEPFISNPIPEDRRIPQRDNVSSRIKRMSNVLGSMVG